MKYKLIYQDALLSLNINKDIGYYQRQFEKQHPYNVDDIEQYSFQYFKENLESIKQSSYFDKVEKMLFNARQDVLKSFYTIEYLFLKYMISDILQQYNIITYYAYRFNQNTKYETCYPFNIECEFVFMDEFKKMDVNTIIEYAVANINHILCPKIYETEHFNDKKYLINYHQYLNKSYKNDKENFDIICFSTFFTLAYMELYNNETNDRMLIFPVSNFMSIIKYLKLDYSLIENNNTNLIDELNFYINNSFIKMYEYDYKNNKDLYLIDHFNESKYILG